MRTLSQLLDAKPLRIVSIPPDASVFQALETMARYDIGALLVMEESRLVGIISERDYARKVTLFNRASRDIPVSDIMSDNVVCVTPASSVEECLSVMTEHRVRHLPVVQGGAVMGVLSIGDLVKDVIADQAFAIKQMSAYIMS
ncbi:MAG: CBS domain-containing protein [Vicinamibacterales bacterium]|nr:CBS domain-containing protein [Vicinamibacterales bacterium]